MGARRKPHLGEALAYDRLLVSIMSLNVLRPIRRECFWKRSLFFLSLIALISLLTGCSASPKRIWLNAPDWSRAQRIGNSMTGDPPVFAMSPEGETYFLLVDSGGDKQPMLQGIVLDASGMERWSHLYPDAPLARPDQPRAYWTSEGVIFMWISEEQLYRTLIDPASGAMLTPPTLLSGDQRVGTYDAAVGRDGRLVVWFGGPRTAPGLFQVLETNGSPTPMLIDPEGIRPQLTFDDTGELHALWAHHPMGQTEIGLWYWRGNPSELPGQDAIQVATPVAGTSSVFVGPALGMDATHVYVAWSIEVRTGLNAGLVQSQYVSFLRNHPRQAGAITDLFAPFDYHLRYESQPQAALQAGRRSSLTPPLHPGLTQFSILSTDLDETASIQRQLVAFTMRKKAYQTSVLFWRDGRPDTYQLLSFTPGDTLSPYLAADSEDYLYAAWLERGAQGFDIYFASTAPRIVTSYKHLSLADYGAFLGQTLFGLLMGALLLPFAMMWMIVPILLFLITFPLRRDSNELRHKGNLISLSLALGGYWIAKLSTLASLTEFVPFSPWIPVIPEWMEPVLQVMTPIGILAAGLWIAWQMTYKREHYSPLLFMLVYLAVDGVMTAAIYSPIILGTN